jgi:hypothetical protein
MFGTSSWTSTYDCRKIPLNDGLRIKEYFVPREVNTCRALRIGGGRRRNSIEFKGQFRMVHRRLNYIPGFSATRIDANDTKSSSLPPFPLAVSLKRLSAKGTSSLYLLLLEKARYSVYLLPPSKQYYRLSTKKPYQHHTPDCQDAS